MEKKYGAKVARHGYLLYPALGGFVVLTKLVCVLLFNYPITNLPKLSRLAVDYQILMALASEIAEMFFDN